MGSAQGEGKRTERGGTLPQISLNVGLAVTWSKCHVVSNAGLLQLSCSRLWEVGPLLQASASPSAQREEAVELEGPQEPRAVDG